MTFAVVLLGIFLFVFPPFSRTQEKDKAEKQLRLQRERMVKKQLEGRDITDSGVLQAMLQVRRHEFVPPRLLSSAYADRPLPIGCGQTISQPYIVACMTQMLDVKPGDRILEIGTGSGYQAAILSCLTDKVYTIEIIPQLARESQERLKRLGYNKVHTKEGDGYYGWKEHAPYDGIIVTAAATHIPPPLLEQLKEGGRMVIPVGSTFFVQTLMLVKKEEGKIRTSSLMGVRFVPLTGGHD